MLIEVNLPILVTVNDYHEFDEMERLYKKIIPSIKVFELGFNKRYVGVVYSGEKPDEVTLEKMLKAQKIQLIK